MNNLQLSASFIVIALTLLLLWPCWGPQMKKILSASSPQHARRARRKLEMAPIRGSELLARANFSRLTHSPSVEPHPMLAITITRRQIQSVDLIEVSHASWISAQNTVPSVKCRKKHDCAAGSPLRQTF